MVEAAPAEARVDLVVDQPGDAGPSEYERHRAATGHRDLADLDDEAVAALAAETGADPAGIAALAR